MDQGAGHALGMSENAYTISEIVGTSKSGVDDAIRGAVERAAEVVQHLDWFEVTGIRGHIEDQRLCHFQVTLKVGSRLEEPD
jgi:dodecin